MCRVQCTTGPLAQATPWQKPQTFVSPSLSAHSLTYRSGLQCFIIRPNRHAPFAMLCNFFESWSETSTVRFACFDYIRVRRSNVVMSTELPHYYLTQSDLDLRFSRLRCLASWMCARRLPLTDLLNACTVITSYAQRVYNSNSVLEAMCGTNN